MSPNLIACQAQTFMCIGFYMYATQWLRVVLPTPWVGANLTRPQSSFSVLLKLTRDAQRERECGSVVGCGFSFLINSCFITSLQLTLAPIGDSGGWVNASANPSLCRLYFGILVALSGMAVPLKQCLEFEPNHKVTTAVFVALLALGLREAQVLRDKVLWAVTELDDPG